MTSKRRHRRGFSLLECILLVLILGIVGAAAGRAILAAARSPAQNDRIYQLETSLISKMEQIRALPFNSVAVGSPNTTLTDSVTIYSTAYQRTVTVTLADGDGNGAADATFKRVNISCGGMSVETLISP